MSYADSLPHMKPGFARWGVFQLCDLAGMLQRAELRLAFLVYEQSPFHWLAIWLKPAGM